MHEGVGGEAGRAHGNIEQAAAGTSWIAKDDVLVCLDGSSSQAGDAVDCTVGVGHA